MVSYGCICSFTACLGLDYVMVDISTILSKMKLCKYGPRTGAVNFFHFHNSVGGHTGCSGWVQGLCRVGLVFLRLFRAFRVYLEWVYVLFGVGLLLVWGWFRVYLSLA